MRWSRYVVPASAPRGTAGIVASRASLPDADGSTRIEVVRELLPTTPDRLSDAMRALPPLARGEYNDPRPIKEVASDHPLSMMRLGVGRSTDLRVWAVVGLGALWGVAPAGARRRHPHGPRRRVADPSPAVRAATAGGIAEALLAAPSAGGRHTQMGPLIDRALSALADPAPEVWEAATNALARYARRHGAAEDDQGGDAEDRPRACPRQN